MKNAMKKIAAFAAALALTACSSPSDVPERETVLTADVTSEEITVKITETKPAETAAEEREETLPETTEETPPETTAEASLSVVPETLSEGFDGGGGGNDGVYDCIRITVSENKYYTENKETTLEEIEEMLSSAGHGTDVIIYDDLAADNAYTELTDLLYKKSISYREE
ncbi:MAG: hypothetical protein NC120_07610 [Ruminococcus sp.]|nr:hypothetical protein [Ruminococcus sp.]